MRKAIAVFIIPAFVFLFAGRVFAMSSESYAVPWDTVNSGGEDTSSSTNYGLRDSIGGQATGLGSSTNFSVHSGYRVGDRDVPYIQFSLFTQDSVTVSTYTTFNFAGNFVVVSTPSLFHVGDMIQAVENVGVNQKMAIGKIVFIRGSSLYVDRWDGSTGLMDISPSGQSDVFRLQTGTSIDFGTLQGAVFATELTGTRISTSAPNGYTVYMKADGGLRSTVHEIHDVTDGQVTPGVEEYGWRVSGSAVATSTSIDYPFTTATVPIQQNTVAVPAEGICLEYRLSVTATTVAGSHAQVVTYSATANY